MEKYLNTTQKLIGDIDHFSSNIIFREVNPLVDAKSKFEL